MMSPVIKQYHNGHSIMQCLPVNPLSANAVYVRTPTSLAVAVVLVRRNLAHARE